MMAWNPPPPPPFPGPHPVATLPPLPPLPPLPVAPYMPPPAPAVPPAGPLPQPPPYGFSAPFGYSPGSRVTVTWSNGQRYPGTVQQVSGSQCLVVFPDGQQHWVDMQYVAPA